jgi:hypothetical protein
MPKSALEVLQDLNPEAVPAAQPPAAANYRDADLEGVSCAACSKFVYTSEIEDGEGGYVPTGYCSLWESNVRGDFVSDGFADPSPPLDENGDEMWDFADAEKSIFEIHLSGSSTEEKEGFVVKEVLRTGEWPVIPTANGLVKKPLRVIRDGRSNRDEGTIALNELVENFKAGAIQNPQIPLSDDDKDHKNITRLNTGFVRDLWIDDTGDGQAKLVAKMEFTEPDVKEKVLRGTYADVSCGIPWNVISRGKSYGAALEHVCITNRPFIDGLGPFLAASDKNAEEVEVAHFSQEQEEEEQPTMTHEEILAAAHDAVKSIEGVDAESYVVAFSEGETVVHVRNDIAETAWTVPFEISDEGLSLADFSDWKVVEEEGDKNDNPSAGNSSEPRELDPLDEARRLRELRLSQPTNTGNGGSAMPKSVLDGLELSDEARAALQSVLDENANLKARTREQEAEARIEELKELGLSDRPGALKFYRQVFLSDDGGAAVVLLSDDGKEKATKTALEILDDFIEGVKGSDGKVNLSDQHLASGNDNKPPADSSEEKPLEERVAETRRALYGN